MNYLLVERSRKKFLVIVPHTFVQKLLFQLGNVAKDFVSTIPTSFMVSILSMAAAFRNVEI